MQIRLFTFRSGPASELTDQFIRQKMLPGLVSRSGLTHAFAARGGVDGGERVVLSVWQGDEPAGLSEPLDCERDATVAEPRIELVPASVVLSFAPPDDALILRIFRGRANEHRSADYLEVVRQGTLADVAAGKGPLGLFLGTLDDERFVTASVWTDWQRIEEATGGNIRNPIGTRHRDLLVEGTAQHMEIVPGTTVEPAVGESSARLISSDAAGSP